MSSRRRGGEPHREVTLRWSALDDVGSIVGLNGAVSRWRVADDGSGSALCRWRFVHGGGRRGGEPGRAVGRLDAGRRWAAA